MSLTSGLHMILSRNRYVKMAFDLFAIVINIYDTSFVTMTQGTFIRKNTSLDPKSYSIGSLYDKCKKTTQTNFDRIPFYFRSRFRNTNGITISILRALTSMVSYEIPIVKTMSFTFIWKPVTAFVKRVQLLKLWSLFLYESLVQASTEAVKS